LILHVTALKLLLLGIEALSRRTDPDDQLENLELANAHFPMES